MRGSRRSSSSEVPHCPLSVFGLFRGTFSPEPPVPSGDAWPLPPGPDPPLLPKSTPGVGWVPLPLPFRKAPGKQPLQTPLPPAQGRIETKFELYFFKKGNQSPQMEVQRRAFKRMLSIGMGWGLCWLLSPKLLSLLGYHVGGDLMAQNLSLKSEEEKKKKTAWKKNEPEVLKRNWRKIRSWKALVGSEFTYSFNYIYIKIYILFIHAHIYFLRGTRIFGDLRRRAVPGCRIHTNFHGPTSLAKTFLMPKNF